jgi:dephospho-CoA kinase
MRDEAVAAARARGDHIVVCDIPLLFERNLVDEFDVVVLVDAPREIRLERLVRDRDLREEEAMAMIAAQMPAELKRARADVVIDNDSTPAALADRVTAAWAVLGQRAMQSTAELAAQREARKDARHGAATNPSPGARIP